MLNDVVSLLKEKSGHLLKAEVVLRTFKRGKDLKQLLWLKDEVVRISKQ